MPAPKFQYRYWSKEEINFLKAAYGIRPTPYIAKKLGRTITAVNQKAVVLGVSKRSWEFWTPEEKEAALNCEFSSQVPGRSPSAVRTMRWKIRNGK